MALEAVDIGFDVAVVVVGGGGVFGDVFEVGLVIVAGVGGCLRDGFALGWRSEARQLDATTTTIASA